MEEILDIVNDNNVTFISNANNKEIQLLLKNLLAQQKPRIIFTALDKESLMCLQAQLINKKLNSQLILEKGEKIKKEIILMNNDILYDYYVVEENKNIADIIIFYDSEVSNDYYSLIWQIWQSYEKQEQRLPRLILLDNNYHNPKVPFKKDKDNSYKFKNNIKKNIIKYSQNKFSLVNLIEAIDFKLDGQQLVLIPDKRYFYTVLKLIRERNKEIDIYTFDETIYENNRNKIFTPVGKNRIIISTHKYASLIVLEDLSAIYDSCKTSNDFYGNRQIYNISQKIGNCMAKEASKLIYRALEEKTFKELNLVESVYTPIDKKCKIVLNSYKNEHDIKISDEKALIARLEKLDFIRAGKVHQSAYEWLSLDLSLPATYFLRLWHGKHLPLFPGLVLAVIISDCKNSLLFIPPTEENSDKFIKQNYGEIQDDNILIFYLNIFLAFMKKEKHLDKEKSEIQIWCQQNYIHAQTFYYLINKLKKVINMAKKITSFQLGLYDSTNVFKSAKNSLAQAYSEHLYDSLNKVEHIYHNNLGESAVLDKKRFNSGHFIFPEKFISFYKLNNIKGHDMILFYMILEN